MRITEMPIDKLEEAHYNPRKDLTPDDIEYKKIKRSLEEFDLVVPVVFNERTGRLVGGHQRVKVLRDLGKDTVPVSVVDMSEEREKALCIALNNVSGDWDTDKLHDLIQELLATPEAPFEATGFTRRFLDSLEEDSFVEDFLESERDEEIFTGHSLKFGKYNVGISEHELTTLENYYKLYREEDQTTGFVDFLLEM